LRLEVGINFQVPLPQPLSVYRLGEDIPLTPPMLAIAAAGNDAADEENAAAHEAAGSTAEAHPAPHSPPFVDPDTIDQIIYGPHPRPYDFVDPALE
ncbi:hypothetical protein Tco_0805221, partial [Tanacetum coccineum]